MTAESDSPSTLRAWGQLVRLPNAFTVVADVSAAFLLVAQGPQPASRFVCVVLAGISLYWAGMVLNDVFDVEQDREQRPRRPLPAGLIPMGQAKIAGWSLLILGVVLASVSGHIPNDHFPATWVPTAIGVALAIMIVAYDGPLKKTVLAPAAMGCCRVLSFLLGASPCISGFAAAAALPADGPLFPKFVIAIAVGFGLYIMGITTIARNEAVGGPSPDLFRGLLFTMIGAAVLAFAPRTAVGIFNWNISPRGEFPLLIGMIAFPVILRGLRLVNDPTAAKIQIMVRVGILTMIPLAAAFAFLGAGAVWGLLVFSLVIPAFLLARQFRVT